MQFRARAEHEKRGALLDDDAKNRGAAATE
jgi:hypothetical protein